LATTDNDFKIDRFFVMCEITSRWKKDKEHCLYTDCQFLIDAII